MAGSRPKNVPSGAKLTHYRMIDKPRLKNKGRPPTLVVVPIGRNQVGGPLRFVPVAQLAERRISNLKVEGSTPSGDAYEADNQGMA